MCWWKKKPAPPPKPLKPPELVLPHPEEPRSDAQTVNNVDVQAVLTKWLTDWQVPADQWDFWRTKISIEVTDTVAAAGSFDTPTGRGLVVNPAYLNPGVIAHEQAHNSYSYLTDAQKAAFSVAWGEIKGLDPLVKLMVQQHGYALTNDVEGHAELYRYIGQQMAESMKQYYPRLF